MASLSRSVARPLARALLVGLALLFGAPGGARAAALRPRVGVEDPGDADLLRRIRNQTSDLVLEVVFVDPVASSATDAMGRARALGDASDASVVAWIVELETGRFALYLADLRSSQVLKREIGDAYRSGRLGRSAARESVALALRSSLTVYVKSGAIDGAAGAVTSGPTETRRSHVKSDEPMWPRPPHTPEPIADAPPRSRPAAGAEPEREEELATERATAEKTSGLGSEAWRRAFAMVGYRGAIAGDGRAHHAAALRAGFRLTPIELALEGSMSVPTSLEDRQSKVELARHTGAASVALEVIEDESFAIAVALSAGVALYRRETVSSASGVSPEPARTSVSFLGGFDLRVRSRGMIGFEFDVGLDVVPRAPILSYQVGEEVVERNALWTLQPRAGLGILFSSP